MKIGSFFILKHSSSINIGEHYHKKLKKIYSHGQSHVCLTLKSQAMYYLFVLIVIIVLSCVLDCDHHLLHLDHGYCFFGALDYGCHLLLSLEIVNLLIIIIVFSCALYCGCRLLCFDHGCCLLFCSWLWLSHFFML